MAGSGAPGRRSSGCSRSRTACRRYSVRFSKTLEKYPTPWLSPWAPPWRSLYGPAKPYGEATQASSPSQKRQSHGESDSSRASWSHAPAASRSGLQKAFASSQTSPCWTA